MTGAIYYKFSRKGEWELSHNRVGTKAEILASGESILRSLRDDQGFSRARVIVVFESGRKICIRYNPDVKPE